MKAKLTGPHSKRIGDLEDALRFVEWGLSEILRNSKPDKDSRACLVQLRDEAREAIKGKPRTRRMVSIPLSKLDLSNASEAFPIKP